MENGNYDLPRGAFTLFESIVHCVPCSVFSFGQEQGFSIPHCGLIKSALIGFHIIWHSAAFASANNITILYFFLFFSENLFYYKQNRFHSLLTEAGRVRCIVRATKFFASIRFIRDVCTKQKIWSENTFHLLQNYSRLNDRVKDLRDAMAEPTPV